MAKAVTFWFEFASTYSYLTAMRIEARAAEAGIDVTWQPFMLGPIFGAQGWRDSPFNIYPAKGRFMWRDMARRAERYGLPFVQPPSFPQNTIFAARVAHLAVQRPVGPAFCRALYHAQFAEGRDLGDAAVVAEAASAVGLPSDVLEAAVSDANKQALKNVVADAMARGIFGAPSFTVGDELFWGDDQLEQALDWAKR